MLKPELLLSTGVFINGVRNLTAAEAGMLCGKGAVLLDLRPAYATLYKQFKVENVVNIPAGELKSRISGLSPHLCYITADASGLHSRHAAKVLAEAGFAMVANLAGGMVDWERCGGAVSLRNDARLSGSCMCQLKPR